MKQRLRKSPKEMSARIALRRRVMSWYARFNGEKWDECWGFVDPRLTSAKKVERTPYVASLARFKSRYGAIHTWHVRISLHLTGTRPASDPRPFAYVYAVWQDDRHGFHMFRERWVLDGKKWYTEVAGLVVNDANVNQAG